MIRAARLSDLKAWSAMRADLWPDTDDAHIGELEAYFDGTSPDIVQAYVIELDEVLAGFLELNIRSFAEGSRHPRVPYVEAWYIVPAQRGQGWGTQLMQTAEQWALDQGFTELASDTEIDNHTSIAMHQHLGFKETERVVCFLKTIAETSPSQRTSSDVE